MKWHVDEKKGLVLKQLKSGHCSEFAAQIGVLATIASSISNLEMFKHPLGYCSGRAGFFDENGSRSINNLSVLREKVDLERKIR